MKLCKMSNIDAWKIPFRMNKSHLSLLALVFADDDARDWLEDPEALEMTVAGLAMW